MIPIGAFYPPYAGRTADIYRLVREGTVVILRRRFRPGHASVRIDPANYPERIVKVGLGYYDLPVIVEETNEHLAGFLFFDASEILNGKNLLESLADFHSRLNRQAGSAELKWFLSEYYRSLAGFLGSLAEQHAETLDSILSGISQVKIIARDDVKVRFTLRRANVPVTLYKRTVGRLGKEILETARRLHDLETETDRERILTETVELVRRLGRIQDGIESVYMTLDRTLSTGQPVKQV